MAPFVEREDQGKENRDLEDFRENSQGTMADTHSSSQFIARKTKAALDGGLSVILCVGETLEVTKLVSTGDCSRLTEDAATRRQQDDRNRHQSAEGGSRTNKGLVESCSGLRTCLVCFNALEPSLKLWNAT